jgi:transcription elongation factor Elf1
MDRCEICGVMTDDLLECARCGAQVCRDCSVVLDDEGVILCADCNEEQQVEVDEY